MTEIQLFLDGRRTYFRFEGAILCFEYLDTIDFYGYIRYTSTMIDDKSYRKRIITFGLYLGYDKAGTALKDEIISHCKSINVKPSAWIRKIIKLSLPKNIDNAHLSE